MSFLTTPARRHQLVMFFVLAYAFSWWAWVWYQLDPDNVGAPILPWGPAIAAAVMLALIGGRPALRDWLAKIVHWRVAPRWYAFALLVPPALTFGAVALNLALGSGFGPHAALPGLSGFALQFVFLLVWIGLGEEPAWRGYALPRLLVGRTALSAALLLGLLHVLWHLPLYGLEYNADNVLPWAITVICVSIVTAWMWLHTGGSLLLPALLHAANNTAAFVWRWFAGPDQVRLWWIWAALWVGMTVVIVAIHGRQLVRSTRTAVSQV